MSLCQDCGQEFSMVGQHYRQSSCTYPKISKHDKEILEGVLMGDGCIPTDSGNPKFVVEMTNKDFLEFLSETLTIPTTVSDDGYTHILRTVRMPSIKKIRDKWYKSSGKTFPKNINYSRTHLKYWYVCDGHYSNNRATIACSNEYENKEKIKRIFNIVNVTPKFYSEGAWLSSKETEVFLDEIGQPIPGFEHKWGE